MLYELQQKSYWQEIKDALWKIFCWCMIYGMVFTIPLWTWFSQKLYERNTKMI